MGARILPGRAAALLRVHRNDRLLAGRRARGTRTVRGRTVRCGMAVFRSIRSLLRRAAVWRRQHQPGISPADRGAESCGRSFFSPPGAPGSGQETDGPGMQARVELPMTACGGGPHPREPLARSIRAASWSPHRRAPGFDRHPRRTHPQRGGNRGAARTSGGAVQAALPNS